MYFNCTFNKTFLILLKPIFNISVSIVYYVLFSVLMCNVLRFKFYIYYISVDTIYIDEKHIVEKYKLKYSSNAYSAIQYYTNAIKTKKLVHVCYGNM